MYLHSFEAGANIRAGFPVYGTLIEANHISKRGDAYAAARLTDEDRAEIRALARDPRIGAWVCGGALPSRDGWEGGCCRLGLPPSPPFSLTLGRAR